MRATAALRCTAPGWQPWEKMVGFKEPVGAWDRASSAVRSQVESDPPQIPVDDVTLTLSGFTGEAGAQVSLLRDVHDGRRRRLVEVERRLRERMNGHQLHRVVEVAPWHPAPEMRAVQVPIDPSVRDVIRPLYSPKPVEVREGTEREPVSVLMGRNGGRRVSHIEDQLDVRPVVAPKTRKPHLLPDRPGRRQADHPVPRPHQRPLV